MADFSDAADAAAEGLAEGLIEDYEVRNNGRRVRRGDPLRQVQAAAMLEGLAARRAGSIFKLAKFTEPRDSQ